MLVALIQKMLLRKCNCTNDLCCLLFVTEYCMCYFQDAISKCWFCVEMLSFKNVICFLNSIIEIQFTAVKSIHFKRIQSGGFSYVYRNVQLSPLSNFITCFHLYWGTVDKVYILLFNMCMHCEKIPTDPCLLVVRHLAYMFIFHFFVRPFKFSSFSKFQLSSSVTNYVLCYILIVDSSYNLKFVSFHQPLNISPTPLVPGSHQFAFYSYEFDIFFFVCLTWVITCSISLSLFGLFHLTYCLLCSSVLSQMSDFPFFSCLGNISLCICILFIHSSINRQLGFLISWLL